MADNIMPSKPQGPGGRPTVLLDDIVQKLEPFLKSGKSLRKACYLANVPHASVYKYYQQDEEFSDKIDSLSAYSSNLIGDVFFGRVYIIAQKFSSYRKLYEQYNNKEISSKEYVEKVEELFPTQADWEFLKWYASTSRSTKEDFSPRAEFTGENGAPLIPQSRIASDPKALENAFRIFELAAAKLKGNV